VPADDAPGVLVHDHEAMISSSLAAWGGARNSTW